MSAPINCIIEGDARRLIKYVEPGSVKLIFTDPLYDQVGLYVWLEEIASGVLAPDGNILAFQSAWHLLRTVRALRTTLPLLSAVQQTNGNLSGNTIAKSYHLIWMGSGKAERFVADGYVSNTWSKAFSHNFKWTKNPNYIAQKLEDFTKPGDLVLDPFAGGGTIPAVCKVMGRRYLAFELMPERVALCRAALEAAQPPTLLPSDAPAETNLFGGFQ